jgi:N-acetyl-gamma-glutamyl-phosphate reductase
MATSERIDVAVAGATGYAGVELVRLLSRHPHVRLVAVTSEQYAGRPIAEIHPFLRGSVALVLDQLDPAALAGRAEIVFTALPHGQAARAVAEILGGGRRVIDISADFRLDGPTYARWYAEHPFPELLREAVYGLPEVHGVAIRGARLVAAPGCYPTAMLLGTLPLVRAGCVAPGSVVTVDAKSGVTGAGRTLKTELLFCEVADSVRPYSVGVHRHTPEMEQEVRRAGGGDLSVLFVPHLLPIRRGILATMYVALASGVGAGACDEAFRRAYAGSPFIDLLGPGAYPALRDVQGTNRCAIGWYVDEPRRIAVVISAIDNLGKGAAGQAVQCMNLQLGCDERAGLEGLALVP